MNALTIDDETSASLEYIERTARLLLDQRHPNPRRAVYLIGVHARLVELEKHRFPEAGWS